MNQFKNVVYITTPQVTHPSSSLNRAVSLANNNQADLTVLSVLPRLPLSTYAKTAGLDEQTVESDIFAHEQSKLKKVIDQLDTRLNIQVQIRIGKSYIEVIRAAQQEQFDLVIKEADETNWLNSFKTSDDMHLLRKCPCPVWLMKKNEKSNYAQIVAAVDFATAEDEPADNELNAMIIDYASSLCLSDFAALHVVNIYDVSQAGFISLWVDEPDEVEKKLYESEYFLRKFMMETCLNQLKEKLSTDSYRYLSPKTHIIKGSASTELPKIAEKLQADLVVMGTVARTGLAGVFIGNTAENILNQLTCSVLAIKPKGFVSPVS